MTSDTSYKYVSVDKSILYNWVISKVMDRCVEYLPTWLAPNVITVFGGTCIILNTLIILLCDPKMQSNRFLAFISAVLLFSYSTADNIDGKQARRTKSCSSFGQIMDHGVDSAVLTLSSIIIGSNFGIGYPDCFLYLLPGCMNFYMVTLSEFYTKIFSMWYINGPNEGIYSAILLYLAVSIFSKNFLNFVFKRSIRIEITSKMFKVLLTNLKKYLFSHFDSFEIFEKNTQIEDTNIGNSSNVKTFTKPGDTILVEYSFFFISMIICMFILSISSIYTIILSSTIKKNINRLLYDIFLPYAYLTSILILSSTLPRNMTSMLLITSIIMLSFSNQVITIIHMHLIRSDYVRKCTGTILFIVIGLSSRISLSYPVLIGYLGFLVCEFLGNIYFIANEMTNGFAEPIFRIKNKSL